MSDNGSSALNESIRSVSFPSLLLASPTLSIIPIERTVVLMSLQQTYLGRPRGPGERASSVPAHRDEHPAVTKPVQWDPWAASLPPSRDLSAAHRVGMCRYSHSFPLRPNTH